MAGKRGHNEGTIRKRPDGRWEARMSLQDGKRKSFYGDTRQEVSRKVAAAIRDNQQGITISDERLTVKQYLFQWLDIIKHEIDGSSHIAYKYHMKRVIDELGEISMSKLKPQQIQLFYAKKLEEGLAPTTVNTMHGVLHHALKDGVRLNILSKNVADLVKAPRFEPKPRRVLSEPEVQRLLEAAKGERMEAIYSVVLSTAMREGELFALQWEDIDFEHNMISVLHGLQRAEKGYIVDLPKSKSSRRTITLTDFAKEALLKHRERQQQEKNLLGDEWNSKYDFVFANQFGGYKKPSLFLAREFKRVLLRGGLGVIHFHELRHTCATLLLSKGVNAKVVSEMLGHAHISITLAIYGHVLPNMQRDAADIMNRILRGGKET